MPTSVPFEEIAESPIGKGSRKGDLVFNREFQLAWDDAPAFVIELLFGGVLGLPKQFPGWPAMRVQEVSQEPYLPKPLNNTGFYDVEAYLNRHPLARIKVTYGPLQAANANDNLPDGTYAEYEQDEAGEFFEIKDAALYWESGNVLIEDIHPTILIGMTDHSLSWHRVPSPPWAAISDLKGRINDAAFRIPATGQWVAAGTLLFMGSKVKKTFNLLTANPTWSMSYRFRERAVKAFTPTAPAGVYDSQGNAAAVATTVVGWNFAYRNSTGTWERRVNAFGDPEYSSGDMSRLFAFEIGFT